MGSVVVIERIDPSAEGSFSSRLLPLSSPSVMRRKVNGLLTDRRDCALCEPFGSSNHRSARLGADRSRADSRRARSAFCRLEKGSPENVSKHE